MSEKSIQNSVMLAASQSGMTVWRNNTGQAWTGDATRLKDGSILIRNPRPLHAGLCKGSSDLIGIRPVVVTAEMLGQTIAQFAAVEVKTPKGKLSEQQAKFLSFVESKGGLALVARSADDILTVA
ncbi:VRR-NUC domain-containing protein [Thiocapsa roseopersicina]|uniref:VRR-NUC domain-containing protein n=1 Tax=Thiocapsa roseopersicina TaxID=1058 RepID=A0A1H3DQD1_THIRO|nr:VRR-NUC domain-containing protein [Thiocapsa roseopersicina]SDX68625.1 VRR-NUC domain-containing protein [Thiocapsa roseopersicina]